MITVNAVLTLNGKEIVPVRAIPYVTGGDIDPSTLVGILQETEQPLWAYVHEENGTVTRMLPKNWKHYGDALAATGQSERSLINQASIGILPPSTFVYWDMLWGKHEAYFLPPRDVIDVCSVNEKENYELQPNAIIPKELVALIFEGFEALATTAAAPPKPGKSMPDPLTTGDVAHCFAGLRWTSEEAWKRPLGDKPKWLRSCVVRPGRRGVSETYWNPVLIGAAIVQSGHAKQNSVRARFQTMPQLQPWLDEWKSYEADNLCE